MTAETYQWRNTLCQFTNGDFFQTFYRRWALPPGGISCSLCRVLHRQRLVLFTIISSPMKFAECLCCDVSSPPILHVLSRFIESPVT
ncbi:hypothetical protein MTR_3g035330 [Medicago truncatula]|uniref:Uncharacterized protein n=1 Tax=Medicago truncatula TaxID=3880 RepID=G7J0Y2_MEDTR|nr:hypothetical protein MTR_3g035330 [Medicago truncatula]